MTVIYILSVNMSVGIVAMTDPGAGNPDYPVSRFMVNSVKINSISSILLILQLQMF